MILIVPIYVWENPSEYKALNMHEQLSSWTGSEFQSISTFILCFQSFGKFSSLTRNKMCVYCFCHKV